jgi:hypothetical protein
LTLGWMDVHLSKEIPPRLHTSRPSACSAVPSSSSGRGVICACMVHQRWIGALCIYTSVGRIKHRLEALAPTSYPVAAPVCRARDVRCTGALGCMHIHSILTDSCAEIDESSKKPIDRGATVRKQASKQVCTDRTRPAGCLPDKHSPCQ